MWSLFNYVPHTADLVQAVRNEVETMHPHYTPGEIWVGTKADVGAHISMSKVRGDNVLWMDDQALTASAFVKDGKKRKCSFRTLNQASSGQFGVAQTWQLWRSAYY